MMHDRDIWAVAVNILDVHGDHVDQYLLDKIAEMSEAANEEGLELWLAIAECVSQLLDAPTRATDLN